MYKLANNFKKSVFFKYHLDKPQALGTETHIFYTTGACRLSN